LTTLSYYRATLWNTISCYRATLWTSISYYGAILWTVIFYYRATLWTAISCYRATLWTAISDSLGWTSVSPFLATRQQHMKLILYIILIQKSIFCQLIDQEDTVIIRNAQIFLKINIIQIYEPGLRYCIYFLFALIIGRKLSLLKQIRRNLSKLVFIVLILFHLGGLECAGSLHRNAEQDMETGHVCLQWKTVLPAHHHHTQ
jgi:hypothetical protein